MKRLLIAGALALPALGLAGPSLAASHQVLNIGVVSTLEGPGASWGRGIDGGTRIAAKEVNAAGGLRVAGKTYIIKVTSYNTSYTAAKSVTAVDHLIEQDHIRFILGPLGSAAALADKPIFERHHVLALTDSYTPKELPGAKYVFRVLPTTAEYANPMVDWMKAHRPGITRVAVISPNDETGWDSQKVQRHVYSDHGYKVVDTELFQRGTTDFQPLITRMLTKSPNLIELDTTPPSEAGLIMRQARDLGYKGTFSKVGGPGVVQIVKAAGIKDSNGTIIYIAANASTKKYKWLEQQYSKIYPLPMNSFNVFFYDAAHMLFSAMQKAGTVTNTAKVMVALQHITPYEGMQGKLVWGGLKRYGTKHQLETPGFVGLIEDGKAKIVAKFETR